MITIKKEKKNRPITEQEFNILKETKPFKDLRKNAKQCFPVTANTEVLTDIGYINLAQIIDKIDTSWLGSAKDFIKIIGRDGKPKKVLGTIKEDNHYIIEFSLANGDILRYSWAHLCPIIRDDVEMLVPAIDVQSTDEFLEF